MPNATESMYSRAGTGVFTWTFPGAPVSIQLDESTIQQLAQLTRGVDGSRAPDVARGGILLGYASADGRIEMTGCESVAAENGELHRAIVRARQMAAGGQRAVRGEPSVVGFYRTESHDHLTLEQRDFEIIHTAFHEKNNVFLLIRQDATAGFFFWDGDQVPDICFLEFPLDLPALPLERNPAQANAISKVETPAPENEKPAGRRGVPWRMAIGSGAVAAGLIGGAVLMKWNARPTTNDGAHARPLSIAALTASEARPSTTKLPPPPRIRLQPPVPAANTPAALMPVPVARPIQPPPVEQKASAPATSNEPVGVPIEQPVQRATQPVQEAAQQPAAAPEFRPVVQSEAKPPESAVQTPPPAAPQPKVSEPRAIRPSQPVVAANYLRLLTKEVVVSVQLEIDANGNVVKATAETPAVPYGDYFAQRAQAAARLWKFDPARVGEHAVSSSKILTFRFRPGR